MATTEFVLWGRHPSYVDDVAIKLTGGTLRECRAEQTHRKGEGQWLLGIYVKGVEPVGLKLLKR